MIHLIQEFGSERYQIWCADSSFLDLLDRYRALPTEMFRKVRHKSRGMLVSAHYSCLRQFCLDPDLVCETVDVYLSAHDLAQQIAGERPLVNEFNNGGAACHCRGHAQP